jgi:hypothetical protein
MGPSFFSRKGYLALQRSTVHPLLALCLPTLFLLSLNAVVRAAMPALSFPPRLFSLVLPLIGIEEVAIANLLFAERAGRGARLRELLSILVVLWLVLALMRSISAGSAALFHPALLYPLVLVLLEWVFVWAIHQRLREREILLSALAGKQGEVLLHELRDASMQAAVAARALAAVKILAALFQTVIFTLLLFCAAQGIRVGVPGLMLCAANALLGLLAMGVLSMFAEHQLLLGEGLVMPGRQERARFLSMLSILLICSPAAFLASRGDAPLPLSAILSLLERLLRLLPSLPLTGLADAASRMVLQQQRYEAMLRSMPQVPLNPLFLLLLEFLRRLIPVLILMAIYFFLVSPLLSEEFLQSLRSRSLVSFLLRKLRILARFCRRLARGARSMIRRARRGRVPEAADRGRLAGFERRRPARRTPLRKRLQLGRVLSAFNSLLRWSESRGVPYRKGDAPREYSQRLLSLVPQLDTELDLVVDVLEESLFSTHLVEAGRVAAYLAAIEGIRQSPVVQSA